MASKAQKLASYIQNKPNFEIIFPTSCPHKDHIGALFTDIILQAGVNYGTVVYPRVCIILEKYPQASTVSIFSQLLQDYGAGNILNWKNPIKLQRINDLISFCINHKIESTDDLKNFLLTEENIHLFKKIKGIGDKTYDYVLKLLGVETVAVDRHIFSFVEEAGLERNSYHDVKSIVEYAADLLGIPRHCIDYSIWSYMSSD